MAHNFWGDEPFELTDEEWLRLTPSELAQYNNAKRRWRIAAARRKATHTSDQWRWLLDACGNRCVRCGSADRVEKDHIRPIFCGGSDGLDNLQPLCKSCNTGKPDSTDYRPADVRRAVRGV